MLVSGTLAGIRDWLQTLKPIFRSLRCFFHSLRKISVIQVTSFVRMGMAMKMVWD